MRPPQSPARREPKAWALVITIGRERVPDASIRPFCVTRRTDGGCDPGCPRMNVPGSIVSTALLRTYTSPLNRYALVLTRVRLDSMLPERFSKPSTTPILKYVDFE